LVTTAGAAGARSGSGAGWALPGRGKRGGVRVIYYWAVEQEQLLMLFMFAKNERDDLSPAQLKILRQIVEDEYP